MNIDRLVRDADPAALVTIPDPPHLRTTVAHGRASQRRRRIPALTAGLAAGILVAGGTTYGLAAARGGPSTAGHATRAGTAVTAVSGCPGLAALSGTLEKVKGSRLVIKAFGTGRLVTVTTSAATHFNRQRAGTLSDVADGAKVVVSGTGTSRSLAALMINVGLVLPPTSASAHGRPRAYMAHAGGAIPKPKVLRIVITAGPGTGIVTDAHPGTFTVIYSGGTRVRVTTSRATTVLVQVGIGLGQLRTGAFVDAVGHLTPHATLAAGAVEQGGMLPRVTGLVSGQGCSSAAIAAAMFFPGG
jgi:hypothetical protein